MSEYDVFRINSAALTARIEEIKRNPPPEILAYKQAHPEFKTVQAELLASYAGVGLTTLKNLKAGKLTDSSCSTLYLICRAFNLDPAELLNLPRGKVCNPDTCGKHTNSDMEAKQQRIGELREELGAARAKNEALKEVIDAKNAAIANSDNGIKIRNKAIMILTAVIVALAVLMGIGWLR